MRYRSRLISLSSLAVLRGTPGMGYVLPEDGGHPIRVRAGYVPDSDIRLVAERFSTPTVEELEPAETSPLVPARLTRQARREASA